MVKDSYGLTIIESEAKRPNRAQSSGSETTTIPPYFRQGWEALRSGRYPETVHGYSHLFGMA